MFTFIIAIVLILVGLVGLIYKLIPEEIRLATRITSGVLLVIGVGALIMSMFAIVPASHIGVVTTWGKVHDQILTEGGHLIPPWQTVHRIPLATGTAAASKSQAGSKDLQSVHADITVNYHVQPDKVRELFILNPNLRYQEQFVVPAIYEVFKAVVAQYTAEELVTKRTDVSRTITDALNVKLAPYYLRVEQMNLVNFGFSKSFDAAIEEKVTASQKAETEKRNLERVKFQAEQRIAQAEGEAKAIAIQAAAVDKQGGIAYTQLKAIEKWNGQLPTYMSPGAVTPFISIK